jgi:hypothetical protein
LFSGTQPKGAAGRPLFDIVNTVQSSAKIPQKTGLFDRRCAVTADKAAVIPEIREPNHLK